MKLICTYSCCTNDDDGDASVLVMSSSADFIKDDHVFTGAHENWIDFDIPGLSL